MTPRGKPLPGGHTIGQQLFFSAANQMLETGDQLTHGQQGTVVGEATHAGFTGKGLKIQFPGNKSGIDCLLTMLSTSPPPPLPGGYQIGDTLFFTAEDFTAPNGEQVACGQEGKVMGPASLETHKGKGLAMYFQGNKGNLACLLTELSRFPTMSVQVARI